MKKLYQPVMINKLELKNRMVMSPMSIGNTEDGFITDSIVEFYKRRAQGGVGLIIFANMQWDKERFNPHHGALLTDEKFIPAEEADRRYPRRRQQGVCTADASRPLCGAEEHSGQAGGCAFCGAQQVHPL